MGMFKTFHIENEKYEKGLDYDARQVRLAIVHTRQDISGFCYLMEWAVNAARCVKHIVGGSRLSSLVKTATSAVGPL
jgi:hypothetical protein